MLLTRSSIVQVVERYELPIRITGNQNLILLDVEEAWKADIITTLGAHRHSSRLEWSEAVAFAATGINRQQTDAVVGVCLPLGAPICRALRPYC